MGRRKKQDEWNAADKLKVVKEYLSGHNSYVKLGRKYQINESSIRKGAAKYKTFGENAFVIRSANLNYSAAFKEQLPKAYLHGEGSYQCAVSLKDPEEKGTEGSYGFKCKQKNGYSQLLFRLVL